MSRLDNTSASYGMKISDEKTKLMTNNTNGINKKITVNGQRLETVSKFKYLGSVNTGEGSKPEIISRIAQTTAVMTRLKTIWKDKNITLRSKIRLMRSLVTSLFLYACETWILTAELQRRVQAMEMRCYRKILCISYKDHVTNKEVHNRIKQAIGPYEDLLTMVKRWKLKWYGHISRTSGMTKTILQGTVRGARRRGRAGRTTRKSGQAWTSQRHKGRQTIGRSGDSWLQGRRWCPDDTTGYRIDDERLLSSCHIIITITGPTLQLHIEVAVSDENQPELKEEIEKLIRKMSLVELSSLGVSPESTNAPKALIERLSKFACCIECIKPGSVKIFIVSIIRGT